MKYDIKENDIEQFRLRLKIKFNEEKKNMYYKR